MSVAQSTSVTADAAHDKSGSGLYVVTAQPPTSVGHTLKCNFTHADDLNLIVGYVLCNKRGDLLFSKIHHLLNERSNSNLNIANTIDSNFI